MRSALVMALLLGACFSKPDRLDRALVSDAGGDDACVLCRASGGTCDANSTACVIEAGPGEPVTCPPDLACVVQCDRCEAVDCSDATSCDVMCPGENACDDVDLTCGMAQPCNKQRGD